MSQSLLQEPCPLRAAPPLEGPVDRWAARGGSGERPHHPGVVAEDAATSDQHPNPAPRAGSSATTSKQLLRDNGCSGSDAHLTRSRRLVPHHRDRVPHDWSPTRPRPDRSARRVRRVRHRVEEVFAVVEDQQQLLGAEKLAIASSVLCPLRAETPNTEASASGTPITSRTGSGTGRRRPPLHRCGFPSAPVARRYHPAMSRLPNRVGLEISQGAAVTC